MNPLLDQLHDIEGIDPIGWWPLAIGWWVALFLCLVLLTGCIWYTIKRRAFQRSWRKETLKELDELEKKLTEKTAQQVLITLSTLLRRIAVHRFSRHECAGLLGDRWLKWLSHRDPKGFDWQSRGKLIAYAPYTPPNERISPEHIKELIQAIKRWVR